MLLPSNPVLDVLVWLLTMQRARDVEVEMDVPLEDVYNMRTVSTVVPVMRAPLFSRFDQPVHIKLIRFDKSQDLGLTHVFQGLGSDSPASMLLDMNMNMKKMDKGKHSDMTDIDITSLNKRSDIVVHVRVVMHPASRYNVAEPVQPPRVRRGGVGGPLLRHDGYAATPGRPNILHAPRHPLGAAGEHRSDVTFHVFQVQAQLATPEGTRFPGHRRCQHFQLDASWNARQPGRGFHMVDAPLPVVDVPFDFPDFLDFPDRNGLMDWHHQHLLCSAVMCSAVLSNRPACSASKVQPLRSAPTRVFTSHATLRVFSFAS
jgi:hypothetical protein